MVTSLPVNRSDFIAGFSPVLRVLRCAKQTTIISLMDWHRCKFLESCDNLKPLVKKRFGREPNTSLAREIAACLQQGRLFYEAAEKSPLEIAPLQLFYGMVGFSKALVLAAGRKSLGTLKPSHGIRDISGTYSRIAELRLKIDGTGTFQEFNDVASRFTRACYTDYRHNEALTIPLESAKSQLLDGIDLSLQDILIRIPGLDVLYKMTFGTEALTTSMALQAQQTIADGFRMQVEVHEAFRDLQSLKHIVDGLRERFPVLRRWRLALAEYTVGRTIIWFENLPVGDLNEFSNEYASCSEGSFQHQPTDEAQRFELKTGLDPTSGWAHGGMYIASPISSGAYVSEFSLHYLALFLLSSLVRYRPQIWAHAISKSTVADKPADDKMLSLIERFLDLNRASIPELVVRVLNPGEDYYNSYQTVGE